MCMRVDCAVAMVTIPQPVLVHTVAVPHIILPRPTVTGTMFGDLLKTTIAASLVVDPVTSIDVTIGKPAKKRQEEK